MHYLVTTSVYGGSLKHAGTPGQAPGHVDVNMADSTAISVAVDKTETK